MSLALSSNGVNGFQPEQGVHPVTQTATLCNRVTNRHKVQSTMQRGVFKLPSRSLPITTIEQTSGCLIVNDYNSSTGKETVSIIPG